MAEPKLKKKVKGPLGKAETSIADIERMLKKIRAENCGNRSERQVSTTSDCPSDESSGWKLGGQKTDAEKQREATEKRMMKRGREKWWI